MNFSQTLDSTLKNFGITGKLIATRSGVSEQMISNFRRGEKRIYTDSLEKIIAALPPEAQDYFYARVTQKTLESRCPTALELIERMNPIELAELLNAIAERLVEQQQPKISA